MQFSANLGFLWTELALPAAVRAAAKAGFDAVECHWPYDTRPGALRTALDETGMALMSLNTRKGGEGEFGLSALPGREAEARAAIDEAIGYGAEVGAGWVHVMAGKNGDETVFLDSLSYACEAADRVGMGVLIEALNPQDVPGYLIPGVSKAVELIEKVSAPNLRLMFDCYHVAKCGEDVLASFEAVRQHVGHVQFAAVPDRGAPDHGSVDYASVLPALTWDGPFGAEYLPIGPTEDTLGWLKKLKG